MPASGRSTLLFALGTILWGLPSLASADDWPQWRGPRQDGISRETGLLPKWPADGPAELWRTTLGSGFSSVSVVGDRAYTLFGAADGEYAVALDAGAGKTLWKVRLGDLFTDATYGDGPRATPAVDEGRLYALGGKGSLVCLDAATGKRVWGFDLTEKFAGQPPQFGFAASPVVVGKMLVVAVGAKQGKSLAAFDKTDGRLLWTSLDDRPGYSTPVPAELAGVPQLLVLTGEALVSVAPNDGREYWRHEWKTTLDANVATPIVSGDRVFLSTGYGTGCGLFEVTAAGGKPSARLLWANKEMKNNFSTSVLVDGYLYGFNNLVLTCMDFRTGQTQWRQRGFNSGSLLAADGKLIIFGERAKLALAEISPKAYTEISQAPVLEGRTWTVPTLSGGRLFVRNAKEMVCLKMKQD